MIYIVSSRPAFAVFSFQHALWCVERYGEDTIVVTYVISCIYQSFGFASVQSRVIDV